MGGVCDCVLLNFFLFFNSYMQSRFVLPVIGVTFIDPGKHPEVSFYAEDMYGTRMMKGYTKYIDGVVTGGGRMCPPNAGATGTLSIMWSAGSVFINRSTTRHLRELQALCGQL